MTIALESMAVAMPEVDGPPNRAAFRGVLTVVDVPSQRAPAGSKGRRVMLTKGAAEAALPSLLGMALDYAPSFDRHDVRRKVGVITSAELVGRNLEVAGYLYAKDFPDIVAEIAKTGRRAAAPSTSSGQAPSTRSGRALGPWTSDLRVSRAMSSFGISAMRTEGARLRTSLSTAVARLRRLTASIEGKISPEIVLPLCAEADGAGGAGLGMSFEVTDVLVSDTRERVWTLMKVTFTGAAILRKNKAAYQDTWIEMSC